MNMDHLNDLLSQYEARMEEFYDPAGNDELFKWRALKCFQTQWFDPRIDSLPFAERFKAATEQFGVLIDNSHQHPRNGVIKLCEREEDEAEVKRLFCEVLFADDHGDLSVRQQNMDAFISGFEKLRMRRFPANWSYKQDRHSASVYLAMYRPEENYIYKYTEAEQIALHLEYGYDLGSGESFRLDAYYQMMDEIASEIRQRASLIQKFQEQMRLHAAGCDDPSLHLLTFDFVYCCHAYCLYRNLNHLSKREAIRKKREQDEQKQARLSREKKRAEILAEMDSFRGVYNLCNEISLLNVQVTARNYGVGTVVSQQGTTIHVQFAEEVIKYELHKKYLWLPKFESDREIVELFTQAGDARDRLRDLEGQLQKLQ